ncbi:MAG: acetylxylan esterase [Anaerolineaceae bacterium]|nr:acetylxylan esterase [Anaerolineaceae bacterium]
MRLFEIILLAITVLSFLLRFLPLKKPTWIYLLPTLNLLALAYHLFFEGARWQMIPLYILAIAFILMGIRKIMQPERTFKLGFTILAAILLLVGGALPALLPVPVFPATQGPYAVGTTSFYWVDEDRLEAYSPDPDLVYADPPSDPRQVMVQVWYPATVGQVGEPAPYLPDGVIDAQALSTSFGFSGFFLNHFQHATTNSLLNAPIATCFEQWPVLVFSHGWNGMRYQNTAQMEALASHGYIVFAPEHAYGAVVTVYPDGTRVYNKDGALPSGVSEEEYAAAAYILGHSWVGDLVFTLDQIERLQSSEVLSIFQGYLDTTRIGMIGHSTGGGAVLQTCWQDERCKAVVGEDPWLVPYDRAIPASGLSQPSLNMFSENWAKDPNLSLLNQLWDNQPPGAQRMTILGTQHYDFSDISLYSPLGATLGLKGPISAEREISLFNDFLVGFFDQHLVNPDSTRLDVAIQEYHEVNFEQK